MAAPWLGVLGAAQPGGSAQGDQSGVLRLALVVRKPIAGSGGGPSNPIVVLRDVLDARVLLGCYLDGEGHVQRWVEVWVQDVAGLAESLPTYRETLTNRKLDDRWVTRSAAMGRGSGSAMSYGAGGGGWAGGLVRSGWESKHPAPTALDQKTMTVTALAHPESGARWALCEDDAALAKAGLPAFSSSLHRYIHVPALGDKSVFVPVTPGAPENDRTAGIAHALGTTTGGANPPVPVNLGGGLMLVCPHEPLSYEAYVDALTGLEADSVPAAAGSATTSIVAMAAGVGLTPGKPAGSSGSAGHVAGGLSGGLLSLGRGGRSGRLVETLHLKVRVLADAFGIVRDQTAESQLP